MKKVVLVAVVFCLMSQSVFAAWPRRANRTVYYGSTASSTNSHIGHGENSTAQGIANIMARLGRVGHFGGNPGYEGCGSGSSPEAAYNNCCYSRSGMATVDVGYAQGSNGMWYCCRRYR